MRMLEYISIIKRMLECIEGDASHGLGHTELSDAQAEMRDILHWCDLIKTMLNGADKVDEDEVTTTEWVARLDNIEA